MPLWLLLACAGNIKALYEQEKSVVLADPGAAGADWEPEARLRFSPQAVDRLASTAVDAGLVAWEKDIEVENALGVPLRVSPKAHLTELRLRPAAKCGGCLEFDAEFEGTARWKAGPLDGRLPFSGSFAGAMTLEVAREGHAWDASAAVSKVSDVRVSIGDAGEIDLGPYLKGWTKDALAEVPPLHLGRFGGDKLPLRALRVGGSGDAVEIQALTDVAGGGPVSAAAGAPAADWELRMSQRATLALMRRAAFEAGTLEYDVAVDPRSLRIEGDDFTLGLRLWRLAGAGWWRDYTVTGKVKLDERIRFRSTGAVEGEKSRGAGLADPLALLAEGRILDAVADGVRQAFPAEAGTQAGGMAVEGAASSVLGEGDALVVTGTLEAQAREGKERRKGPVRE